VNKIATLVQRWKYKSAGRYPKGKTPLHPNNEVPTPITHVKRINWVNSTCIGYFFGSLQAPHHFKGTFQPTLSLSMELDQFTILWHEVRYELDHEQEFSWENVLYSLMVRCQMQDAKRATSSRF
jgi:hypothetical protein